jgi:hypothetical protein
MPPSLRGGFCLTWEPCTGFNDCTYRADDVRRPAQLQSFFKTFLAWNGST